MERPILTPTDFQRDCGERLRTLLTKLNLPLVEAAKIMGVSKHVLNHWLAGNHPVQPYALYRLTVARGVDFNYVYSGDWAHLSFQVAREMDAELTAKLAVASAAADQEA